MFSPTVAYDGAHHHQGSTGLDSQPMNLGSPPAPSVHSPYLPGFLLGDKVQRIITSPGQKVWSGTSPPRAHIRGTPGMTPQSQTTAPRLDVHTPKLIKDKVGAPPIKSLACEIGHSPAPGQLPQTHTPSKHVSFSYQHTPRSHPTTPAPPVSGLSQSLNTSTAVGQDQGYTSPPSPAQVDPFYTQGDQLRSNDPLDETCVTVFGFPPAAASYILQQFAQYGTVVKHEIASEGNWMHLKFQSRLQAKKALSKNGKIFGNGIMIGVTRCIEKTMTSPNLDDTGLSIQETQALDASAHIDIISARGTPTMIRPLTAAYQAARSENEVIATHGVPQKSNNFVSKAMEFVFGW